METSYELCPVRSESVWRSLDRTSPSVAKGSFHWAPKRAGKLPSRASFNYDMGETREQWPVRRRKCHDRGPAVHWPYPASPGQTTSLRKTTANGMVYIKSDLCLMESLAFALSCPRLAVGVSTAGRIGRGARDSCARATFGKFDRRMCGEGGADSCWLWFLPRGLSDQAMWATPSLNGRPVRIPVGSVKRIRFVPTETCVDGTVSPAGYLDNGATR